MNYRKSYNTTHLTVCISSECIVLALWELNQSSRTLQHIEQILTEIPCYYEGLLINSMLLEQHIARFCEEHRALPEQTHVLLDCKYHNQQFILDHAHKIKSGESDTTQKTYLYTDEANTNVWLETTLHPAVVVQLQLLTARITHTLGIVTSFSLCCLHLYFTITNKTKQPSMLYQDLHKAQFCLEKLPLHHLLDTVAVIPKNIMQNTNLAIVLCVATSAIVTASSEV